MDSSIGKNSEPAQNTEKSTPMDTANQNRLTRNTLSERCAAHGFKLDDTAADRLFRYLQLLLKWNKVMNLVGLHGWQKIVDELILDSFHLADFLGRLNLADAPECWDFGSGAGLPGIPLRMVWQKGTYHMVELREKRALFMQTALAEQKLPRTYVFRGRAEDFMKTANPANLLISRAFRPWDKVLKLVQGHLATDGAVLCLTLEPTPSGLPGKWKILATHKYILPAPGPDKPRYFWLLSP